MSLIAGVGDEVVQFAGALVIVAVSVLAWWSTNARPERYRTVLVRSRHHYPVTLRIRTTNHRTVTGAGTQTNSDVQVSDSIDASTSSENTETPQQSRVIPLQEMDSIIDADMAMLDNHRLHFYRRMDAPNASESAETVSGESEMQDNEPASTEQMREMDSIVNAMEADINRDCDIFSGNTDAQSDSTESTTPKPEDNKPQNTITDTEVLSDNLNSENAMEEASSQVGDGHGKKILIKLKYLNDTCKEVEGNLDELLKDFKWRHFSCELSLLRRVRLIFNGRVLEQEAATLRDCGLHHRCVVHAIVHTNNNQRNQEPESPSSAPTREVTAENAPIVERTWDLENILMTLVSVALTVVWFFRCEYSNMFTASASVALFGLTVFYSVAIFGLYLSDTFHFDRRQERPVPAN